MKKVLLSSIFILCAIASFAQLTKPFLRIENGMHTDAGRKICSDSAGNILLSCSDDKTARIWDATDPHGRLIKTLRIPVGDNDEGQISACALSPDGNIAALGGQTDYQLDNIFCIYLLEVQTGRIIKRITDLPGGAVDLKFSPDGKWLAAGLSVDGVYIFDAKNWNTLKRLDGYTKSVSSLTFDKTNRLATACFDGKIRLYNNRFEPIKQEGLSGKEPNCITFNPKGDLLAVCFNDVTRVEVLNGTDLKLQFKPSVLPFESIEHGIKTLAFSADGTRLYGGGTYNKLFNDNKTYGYVLRTWNNEGKSILASPALMESTIEDIEVLPNGNIAIISAYPDIDLLSATGAPFWRRHVAIKNNYAINDGSLRINDSGTAISIKPYLEDAISFDIAKRRLVAQPSDFEAPVNKRLETKVSDLNGYQPLVNSKKFPFLVGNERVNGTDINSNGTQVVLSADRHLYMYDLSTKKGWQTPLSCNAFMANISGNDKTVVASLADGTIRWYSMADGKELLAFYADTGKRRWVLFTPSGYYDASAGAEDILGWHVNNGLDSAASFFPVSRFKSQYYRPDIIDAIFETYNEKEAIKLANSHSKKPAVTFAATLQKDKLPPEVTIKSPRYGSTVDEDEIRINYTVSTRATIKVLVNNRPVPAKRGLKVVSASDSILIITIPHNDCIVTLLAENENGVSPEATLSLKYKTLDKQPENLTPKPTLYVLAIGINEYQNSSRLGQLNYAVNDASEFATAINELKGSIYQKVDVRKIIDNDATHDKIINGLEWISEKPAPNDLAIIFYAGHGFNDGHGVFYIPPVDGDPDHPAQRCIDFEVLKHFVSSIRGNVIVFIDACHSGNAMGKSVIDNNAVTNDLGNVKIGAVAIASCRSRETAEERSEWEHGAFTKALLEGLRGKGANYKNKLTWQSLNTYLSQRVPDLTSNVQHPTIANPNDMIDFPIAEW